MPKIPSSPIKAMHSRQRTIAQFEAAVRILGTRVGAKNINVAGTPISAFRTQHVAILERIDAGSVEVVTRRGQPFLILGLHQVIALVSNRHATRTVREVFATLPTVPPSSTRPRYTSVQRKSPHRMR